MLKLQFRDNRQPPIWLVDERFTLGKDVRNSLVINDEGISAFHAELRREQDFYYLSDCGSQLGTFANGKRITNRYQLRAGDLLRIGHAELELLDTSRANGLAQNIGQRWFLQVMRGEHEGRKFHISGSMTFGRSEKCELCFSNAELSRRHCEFFLINNVLEVKDLASANGVLVNGEKVSTAVLHSGDEIKLGPITLLVIGPKVQVQPAKEEAATVFVPVAKRPSVSPAIEREEPQSISQTVEAAGIAMAKPAGKNRLLVACLAIALLAIVASAVFALV
ncbi:FHA domain-containing protein [Pseudomonas sp. LRF_L74]|uniref:FHA domain-containing protein n=1 Tax=Pseudomonas sp. LRF_L74 TaxID=3369422 RepID=UPI003F60B25D